MFPYQYLLCCTEKVFFMQRIIIERRPGLRGVSQTRLEKKQAVQRRKCCVLTNASGLLPAPVWRRGIAASQHLGALQPVAGEAVEKGLTPGVEVSHRDLSTRGLFGEGATQHKSWKGGRRTDRDRERGRGYFNQLYNH